MTDKINNSETKKTRLRLSERLKLVASFVPEGSRVADIGTDHGYVPIYLAETGKIKSALAMDVRKGRSEGTRLNSSHTDSSRMPSSA